MDRHSVYRAKGAEGDLTSGGSMAALSAIVVAREYHNIDSYTVPKAVVYMTAHTHHTFSKALRIAGMADCVVRIVPMDDAYRMDTNVLLDAIESDKQSGLKPWLISATAGTTDIGAVDPLNTIAGIAKATDIWFHVDAAYGGAFVLCDEGRDRLCGIERSDSLIFDPHKGFFLPSGSGVVLIRDGNKLSSAFHSRGVYMQDAEADHERSPCDFSPELTRPFRGLRLWLPFKLLGVRPFRSALEEKLLLARYFYEQISREDGFVLGPPPDLSVVPFRYVPKTGDPADFNKNLFEAIRDDGRVFLSTTTVNGDYTLRLAVLGYNTHLDAVNLALQIIKEKTAELAEAAGA